jgi:uncharacterized protein YuzE
MILMRKWRDCNIKCILAFALLMVLKLSAEKREREMKVHYDEEVDALYLELSDLEADGVIEIAEGINIDTTADGKLTGIEILKASDKFDIDTILSYTLELDRGIIKQDDTVGRPSSL